MDIKGFERLIREDGIQTIRLWFTDVIGQMKGFNLPVSALERVLTEGAGFDGSSVEGFVRIFESDLLAMPDKDSFFVVPEEIGGTRALCFICDILYPDYTPYESDPRHVLRRKLDEVAKNGYTFYVGPELEFFYFPSDRDTTFLDEGGYFDILPTNRLSLARKQTMMKLMELGIEMEASHHEVAQSQHELDFIYKSALPMADQLQLAKLIVKEYARLNGLYATFMPKPVHSVNGSGMHVHQSLFKGKTNAFYDESDPYSLSIAGRRYIAGLLKHAREITTVTNQWVNSYKRLVPGYEAPVYVSWGRKNRSALVRVPSFKAGKSTSCRAEYRAPDPACNPYLCFAVMLEAGLTGIREELPLTEPVEADIYAMNSAQRSDCDIHSLPGSLIEAIDLTEQSALVRRTFGDDLFEKYLANKRRDWDDYRTQISDYEIKTYLPLL